MTRSLNARLQRRTPPRKAILWPRTRLFALSLVPLGQFIQILRAFLPTATILFTGQPILDLRSNTADYDVSIPVTVRTMSVPAGLQPGENF
jgi:hypothetical protein